MLPLKKSIQVFRLFGVNHRHHYYSWDVILLQFSSNHCLPPKFIQNFFLVRKTTEAHGQYFELPLIFERIEEDDFITDFKCIAMNDYGHEVLPTQIKQAGNNNFTDTVFDLRIPNALLLTKRHNNGYLDCM